MMRNSAALKVQPDTVPTAVLDTRRQYLTEAEVDKLIKAADNVRDQTMIVVAYRHGLRVSELISLRWSQVDLDAARLRVIRLKGSEDSVHPLSGVEIRGLRRLKRSQPAGGRFVFMTTRGGPMTRNGFYKVLAKAGERCGLPDVHPHLLRHGCGFKLVNNGLDTLSLAAYLGHKNIANTQRYCKMDSRRFDGLWND